MSDTTFYDATVAQYLYLAPVLFADDVDDDMPCGCGFDPLTCDIPGCPYAEVPTP